VSVGIGYSSLAYKV